MKIYRPLSPPKITSLALDPFLLIKGKNDLSVTSVINIVFSEKYKNIHLLTLKYQIIKKIHIKAHLEE